MEVQMNFRHEKLNESKITKHKKRKLVPRLEDAVIATMHYNIVNNEYQKEFSVHLHQTNYLGNYMKKPTISNIFTGFLHLNFQVLRFGLLIKVLSC